MTEENEPAKKLRVVFFGTTEFGLPTLSFLLQSDEHEVPLVITRAPAPKGRKGIITPTPIAAYVREHHPHLELAEPEKLVHNEELKERIGELRPDAYITASYGLILPTSYLKLTLHPLCLHPSLLPKLRGPSPIRSALMEGMEKTAVCVFKMVREMDVGPVLLCREQDIDPQDTYATLREKLALLAVQCAYIALREVAKGTASYVPQNDAEATYTKMLGPGGDFLDFAWSARRIVNFVRALAPEPGATCLDPAGRRLKILRASLHPQETPGSPPGLIIGVQKRSFEVAAGDDSAICVHEVQPEGRRVMNAGEYLAGHHLAVGEQMKSLPREAPENEEPRST